MVVRSEIDKKMKVLHPEARAAGEVRSAPQLNQAMKGLMSLLGAFSLGGFTCIQAYHSLYYNKPYQRWVAMRYPVVGKGMIVIPLTFITAAAGGVGYSLLPWMASQSTYFFYQAFYLTDDFLSRYKKE